MRPAVARAMRWMGGFLLGLLLLFLLAGAFLWWWTGTTGSLEWTLDRIAQSQSLRVEGVRGSLRTGIQARHVHWERDGLVVDADDADLAWEPFALVRGLVKLDRVHAARLRIEDRGPPKPKVLPVSLALPVRVQAGDVRIGQLQWSAAGNETRVSDIAGRYSFNSIRHEVDLRSLQWAGGTYRGRATVGAGGHFEVDARLEGRATAPVPGQDKQVPVAFEATVQGPLAAMQARAVVAEGSVAGGGTVTAKLTPWDAQPVPEAAADVRDLDVSKLWAAAPATLLTGHASVRPAGTGTWAIRADLANASPGPWDSGRLPLDHVTADGEWRGSGEAIVNGLDARIGRGAIRAKGRWRREGPWSLRADLEAVDPAALHSEMASVPLQGPVKLDGDGDAIGFDVAVRAAKASTDKAGALALQSADAKGRWAGGVVTLAKLEVRASDASLSATGEVNPKAKSGAGKASLRLPGAQLEADGKLAADTGGGRLSLRGPDLKQALAWAARVPGVPDGIAGVLTKGSADVQGTWAGGWRDPVVRVQARGSDLVLKDGWTVREATASVEGRLGNAAWKLDGEASQGVRRVAIGGAGQLSHRADAGEWRGRVAALDVAAVDPALGSAPWSVVVQRGFDWRFAHGQLEVGAGEALLKPPPQVKPPQPATVSWEPVRYGGGELRTAGKVTGLPLAWIELAGGSQLAGSAVGGDMVFDAQWQVQLGDRPVLRASLVRSRGDVMLLAETAEGVSTRVAAGVREARLTIASEGDRVTATLRWDSERGGTADARLTTRLARGGAAGWSWPADAPIEGTVRADLPKIGVWSLLAPPGWRLRGSLQAAVDVAGTRSDPQWRGQLSADDLAMRSVVDGVELQKGRLRARLDGRRVVIEEFLLHGPGQNGGSLRAIGEGRLGPQGPEASMTATLDRLRASLRVDRQLTVSGNVAARRDPSGTRVTGKLRVDEAVIILPDTTTPKLGDDVVVRNAAAPVTKAQERAAGEAAKTPAQKTEIAVDIDLGNDFRVQGKGVDTHLRGTLAVTGESFAAPRLVGTINAAGGQYEAYGQRLDIERGTIRFTGSPENPALDILAVRPNIPQRVGVLVTGTAYFPYVRLYAEPDLPEAEKLSWLVTGRAAPATGAESALVQQAALAFLAGRSGSGKRGAAATLGLDELSFRRDASEGPSITLGKRFGRNFYAAYERSLVGTVGTVSIFYDITRNITVRGSAGERSAVDLIYTLSFD